MKLFPPYIFEVTWLKNKPGKTRGLALFPFIFVSIGGKEDRSLIEHEKIHIKQQVTHLLVFFYIKYAFYQLVYGYKKNPFEVYAYKHQDDWKGENWEVMDAVQPKNEK